MSIPLILASKSVPRRNVLFSAGICPTIRVSHVDEPAALAEAAAQEGVAVADLPIKRRVTILASAKAQAVHRAYRAVAAAAAAATGDRVIGYPLGIPAAPASADDASVATAGRFADVAGAGVAAESGASAIMDQMRKSMPMSATTRAFFDRSFPTRTEPIREVLADQPGLTSGKVGPLILGCDSMFLLDGECYGKPHSPEHARERLRAMRGATGELWTGHCLIDFATGRVAADASHATVHFGEYTDLDIERYIATGEPLEVAGSFTLEGFGGAFIDSIEGDPHGIIGLSLPLARRLAAQLGVEWTDLWNVTREDQYPSAAAGVNETDSRTGEPLSQERGAEGKSLSPVNQAPKDNVHQPGDGWIPCACGRRHWGTNGASGVLLVRRDPNTGEPTHVVMQHRAMWSAEGGTWGIPGGASADGENPVEGALRESYEEANITPEDIEVVGSYREDHGPWAYTTVFAFEKPGHKVNPRANDDESMEISWIPFDTVPEHRLLTAMQTDWPMFADRIRALAAEHRGA